MRRGSSVAVAIALCISPLGVASAAQACDDRADPSYGSHACKVHRLRERSFVVIAIPDTGINPYHVDFRIPASDDMNGVHPSEFIEGFPTETATFDLALDAPTYDDAVSRDRAEWDDVALNTVYTFPGTKIIGGITFGQDSGIILDDAAAPSYGHGTNVASLAAGAVHGSNRDVETLIMVVQGLNPAIRWAMNQPWVDIVSLSAHCRAPLLCSEFRDYSKAFVERGGIAVVGAGNGVTGIGVPCTPSIATVNDTSGPPWLVIVGAASSRSDQPSCWHDIPPDIIAYGDYVMAASAVSITEEVEAGPGTSFSTPIAAGIVAAVTLGARRALGDSWEGPRGAVIAAGPAQGGLLSDGILTNQEAEEVVLKTARMEPFKLVHVHRHPWIWPNTPVSFIYAGYGVVNERSKQHALAVLFGAQPMPDRSDVDTWMEYRDAASGAFWDLMP